MADPRRPPGEPTCPRCLGRGLVWSWSQFLWVLGVSLICFALGLLCIYSGLGAKGKGRMLLLIGPLVCLGGVLCAPGAWDQARVRCPCNPDLNEAVAREAVRVWGWIRRYLYDSGHDGRS